MKKALLLLVLIGWGASLYASEPKFSEAIEDNSFLIEEAYNQDKGVVQHIFGLLYFPTKPRDLFFSFTQEWPLPDQLNQFSYTLPFTFPQGQESGIGDLFLNYRRQILKEENWLAFAPRLSLILPSGDVNKNLGYGTLGFQVNLPFSKRWNNYLATHLNLGATVLPAAEQVISGQRVSKTLDSYNTGFSVIWLAQRRFNFLLEFTTTFGSEIDDDRNTNRFTQYVLNPGIRASIPLGPLEIVPGLSFPLTWLKGNYQTGLFFYLSFEHPFLKNLPASSK